MQNRKEIDDVIIILFSKSGDVTSRRHSIVIFLWNASRILIIISNLSCCCWAWCSSCGHGWLYGGFSLLGFLYSGVKDYNFILFYLLGEFGFGSFIFCFFRRLPCLCLAFAKLPDASLSGYSPLLRESDRVEVTSNL